MYEIIAKAGKIFDDIENMIYEFAVEAEERFDEARERFDDLDVQVDDITGDGGRVYQNAFTTYQGLQCYYGTFNIANCFKLWDTLNSTPGVLES